MTSCLQISSSIDLTWVYWVALGFLLSSLFVHLQKKMQIHSRGRHSQKVHSHTHTPTPTPTPQLPHWHMAAQSGSQSHPHVVIHLLCSLQPALTSPQDTTPGTIILLSHHRAALPQVHPGQVGSHTEDATLDPSPAAHTEPPPDVPSCGHVAHKAQATQSTTTRASVLIRHPLGCFKDLIKWCSAFWPWPLGAQHSSAIESKPSSLGLSGKK